MLELEFGLLHKAGTIKDNMGIRFAILGTGSKGNSAYLEVDGVRVLIDAGLSARQIVQRLSRVNGDPDRIDAILITHEHSDHIKGLRVFCKERRIPVFCNRDTAEAMPAQVQDAVDLHVFETGTAFSFGPIQIESFPVPHDAFDPVGYLLSVNGLTFAWATDLGYATTLVRQRLRQARVLVLESNHDVRMLQDHPYRPWSLKQRILSRHGHLSNEAAGDLLAEIMSDRLERVWLGHLSEECNRPELALQTVLRRLQENGVERIPPIEIAYQHQPTPMVEW